MGYDRKIWNLRRRGIPQGVQRAKKRRRRSGSRSAASIPVNPDGRTHRRTETQAQQKNQKVFDLGSRLGEVRYRYSTSP